MLDNKTFINNIISRRTFIVLVSKVALLFLLIIRLFYIQFLKQDKYKTLSDKNRITIIAIPPVRGQIYDLENRIIASNKPCFRLLFDKNNAKNFAQQTALIATLLSLDEHQTKELNKRVASGWYRSPFMIMDYLDLHQITIIEEHKLELPSVIVDTSYIRYYPKGSSLAHIIGFIGSPINHEYDHRVVDENFKTGKTGIEHHYDHTLKGEFGYKHIEVNAKGRYVNFLAKKDAIAGSDLYLNIDSEIQEQIMPLLSEQGASASVMDCTNGHILLLCSSPTIDPNRFHSLSSTYWHSLISNPYAPLTNKVVQSTYPPGSPFKIITLLAALEAGLDPNRYITCTGEAELGGNSFRCHKLTGHGAINMFDAIKFSCSSYVYKLSREIGADRILAMAKKFGFGQKTGIDIPGERSGFLPSKQWKQETLGQKWTIGDTLNLSFGQGFALCTPLQLTRFIAAIANNGKLLTPSIINTAKHENSMQHIDIDIQQKYLDIVKAGLFKVINSPGGTGYYNRINHNGLTMCGKTGTAQVRAKKSATDNLNRQDIDWASRNHAIFCGYGPTENPRFAVSVYYDHGGSGGANAAPIARKIMEQLFAKHY